MYLLVWPLSGMLRTIEGDSCSSPGPAFPKSRIDLVLEVPGNAGTSGSAFLRLPILGEDEVEETGFFSLRVWAATAAIFLDGAGMLVGAGITELFVALILDDSVDLEG